MNGKSSSSPESSFLLVPFLLDSHYRPLSPIHHASRLITRRSAAIWLPCLSLCLCSFMPRSSFSFVYIHVIFSPQSILICFILITSPRCGRNLPLPAEGITSSWNVAVLHVRVHLPLLLNVIDIAENAEVMETSRRSSNEDDGGGSLFGSGEAGASLRRRRKRQLRGVHRRRGI